MLSLNDLSTQLKPSNTVLFLGAGSSVPSGGPSGLALAKYLEAKLANGENISDELAELCSILEDRYGRAAVISCVREKLKTLAPTGGLLALPEYDWHAIYTTNYDMLVEKAYTRCDKEINPIRSDFDYGKVEGGEGTLLLKIHGCMTSDIVDGHKARMVLSERDYDVYSDYRHILFNRLQFDMATKDVVVIGYALKDAHLRADMKAAAKLHKEAGRPRRIIALIYEKDLDRANLFETEGYEVVFGGIDEFLDSLSNHNTPVTNVTTPSEKFLLPIELRSSTTDVALASSLEANPIKMFNGSAATYADVSSGYTFRRSCEIRIKQKLEDSILCVSLIGVAGVGKTSVARRVAHAQMTRGFHVWEHNSNFPFKSETWLRVQAVLREKSEHGLLIIDDSPQIQRQVNISICSKMC